MHDVDPSRFVELARVIGPEPDEVVAEMDEKAEAEGFPTVGPVVGGWLRLLARAVDARRIFEFGSGFGYSAYWFAEALPAEGEIVLTEVDGDELAEAREYVARGGYGDLARFELGDAIETVDGYDGPFDVVLIDNEKERYVEAFEAVREKVAQGGLVLADNAMTAGPLEFEDVLALTEKGSAPGAHEMSQGMADYLRRVRDDEGFETVLLPVGSGVAVSVRTETGR
jgi:predicted O-methyltransferase YrrM